MEQPTPLPQRIARNPIVEVALTIFFCAWVGMWWSQRIEDPAILVIGMHLCALFQIAKLGWFFYCWQTSKFTIEDNAPRP